MKKDIQDLREDYRLGSLMEDQVPENPNVLFSQWFDEAQSAGIPEPNAMTLATINRQGRPSARVVLLKGHNEGGFIFYTNYDSQKGQDIDGNPFASLVFLWKKIERQVRIEGSVNKLSQKHSIAYYHSRPKGSQIGAWVSPQSKIIEDRSLLEEKYDQISRQYSDIENLPIPPNWGGYIIQPSMIEFWQGRSSRLHDRLRYSKVGQSWQMDRLAP